MARYAVQPMGRSKLMLVSHRRHRRLFAPVKKRRTPRTLSRGLSWSSAVQRVRPSNLNSNAYSVNRASWVTAMFVRESGTEQLSEQGDHGFYQQKTRTLDTDINSLNLFRKTGGVLEELDLIYEK